MEIAINYLRSWFALDVFAVCVSGFDVYQVITERIASDSGDPDASSGLSKLTVLKTLRVLRLFKLARCKRDASPRTSLVLLLPAWSRRSSTLLRPRVARRPPRPCALALPSAPPALALRSPSAPLRSTCTHGTDVGSFASPLDVSSAAHEVAGIPAHL